MTDSRTLTITAKKHLAAIYRMFGVASALDALDEQKASDKLPGFGLAKAIIERELAMLKSTVLHLNLVEVSNAGIDIATVKDVVLSGKLNGPTILVSFHDLLSGGEDQ